VRANALVCLLAAALAGCGAQSYTYISTGAGAATTLPAAGTAVYSSSVTVSVAGSSVWGALAGIALLGYAFHGPHSGYWDDSRGFVDTRFVPELAPDRLIHEQDCSKPIENPLANLRCK